MANVRKSIAGQDKLLRRALLFMAIAATGGAQSAFSQFIYSVDSGNDVSAYSHDLRTKALISVSGSPFAAGLNPVGIAVDARNSFVFAANAGSNDVSAYDTNALA